MADLSAYDQIPDLPGETYSGPHVLARLVDGLSFRYRWASHGLRVDDLAFTPGEGSMTLGELLDHLRFLARWLHTNVAAARSGSEPVVYPAACDGLPDPSGDPTAYMVQTLEALAALRADFAAMSEAELASITFIGGREPTAFPAWNMLNGPLADALTHVGQLASWRRSAGNPVVRHDVFRGRPPRAP